MPESSPNRRLLLFGPCPGAVGRSSARGAGCRTSERTPAADRPTGEKTKAGFLERARALRDQAVTEGDQAYGAVVVRNGIVVGEGRNYVVLNSDPTAHAELLAVRDAARRLNKRDLSDCDVYSTAVPCPMCQGALYWARIRRYHNASTPESGVAPNWDADQASARIGARRHPGAADYGVHSALMPAALMIGHHFSISALW